jgi:hypothetical protein
VRGSGGGEWFGKPRKWLHFGNEQQYIALSNHGEGNNRELSGHQVGFAILPMWLVIYTLHH